MTRVALAGLRAAGLVSPLDEHFARTVGRIGADERAEVLVAAALASRQVSAGHVCVDLGRLAAGGALVDEAGQPAAGLDWPVLADWIAALRVSPLVGDGDAATPLVLDGARLYLRRYWEHEQRLALAIEARARVAEPVDTVWLRSRLERLFPAATDAAEPDWQRVAAAVALQRRLCVISGGPGTGKTFTVVKLLALLVEQALRRGQPPPRLALLAPTGKAAARLAECIRLAKGLLDCPPEVTAAIPAEAATIHRGLGARAGSATHFRYDAGHPLLADVVLVDEASMVDLALMARLTAAVPAAARLILLGDADQLASVEAGAVLGDICNTGARRACSRALIDSVAAVTGARVTPIEDDMPAQTGIWDCIVQLTHSYRYGRTSGIGALAAAINAGDAEAALAILDAPAHADVERRDPPLDGDLGPSLKRAVRAGFAPCLGSEPAVVRLRALERFRVLCAHRRGPGGVEAINEQIETTLAAVGLIPAAARNYRGRPIIVTRNDYQLALFNGDVGLMAGEADATPLDAAPARMPEDGHSVARALFLGPDGSLRTLSPARLPPHETVFAMSVHKSQGSEFDEVAVVLPAQPSPVVTRELLYTAVTRARHKVVVYASREAIVRAIVSRVERASGLRERLWGEHVRGA